MAMDRLKTEAKVAEETFVQQWDRLKYVMEEDRKLTHETKRLWGRNAFVFLFFCAACDSALRPALAFL